MVDNNNIHCKGMLNACIKGDKFCVVLHEVPGNML